MTPEEEAAQASAGSGETQDSSQIPDKNLNQEGEEDEPPGGTDGTAVYARKEHAKVKKLNSELQTEREARIALEARVQTLQEVATRRVEQPPVVETKRFTSTEAWQKVDNGEWSREQASEYIADSRYIENRNREKQEEKAVREILGPVEDAKKQAFEYVELDPRLRDGTHPQWKDIVANVAFYRKEDPRRTQIQAERLALRQVLGPLNEFKERQRVSQARASGDHHMETQSGGSTSGFKGGSDGKFKDIPDHVKDLWEKSGVSDKDREIEAKYFRENRDRYAKRR